MFMFATLWLRSIPDKGLYCAHFCPWGGEGKARTLQKLSRFFESTPKYCSDEHSKRTYIKRKGNYSQENYARISLKEHSQRQYTGKYKPERRSVGMSHFCNVVKWERLQSNQAWVALIFLPEVASVSCLPKYKCGYLVFWVLWKISLFSQLLCSSFQRNTTNKISLSKHASKAAKGGWNLLERVRLTGRVQCL